MARNLLDTEPATAGTCVKHVIFFRVANDSNLYISVSRMMTRLIFKWMPALLTSAAIHFMSGANGEVVNLEDTGGSSLLAKLVTCDGTNLTVQRISDNKSFTIPISRLTDKSQEAVKAWQSKGGGLIENFTISVATGKNRRTTGQEDFDDKRINLDPVVTITNPDTKIRSREAKVTVLFLGRPVADGSALHVFKKSTFDLPSLEPGGIRDLRIGKISAAYDSRGYSKFGARYAGYVVIVHDADVSNVFTSKGVPTALVASNCLGYLGLKNGHNYDKNLNLLELPAYTDF